MKFSANVKTLADALAPVAKIAPTRATVAILSHMRLEVAGERLIATAFDFEREAEASLAVEESAAGATTVPAARLSEILRNLDKGGRVAFEAGDLSAKVSCGRSRFTLPVLPAGDFPRLGEAPFDCSVEMPAPDLRLALAAAAPSASTEETRYYLQGVYLHADAGKLVTAATDGNRLMRIVMDQAAPEGFGGVIIPSETVREFQRLCDAAGASAIRLDLAGARVRLTAGAFAVTSKVVDGTFPDYRRVIPGEAPTRVRFDRDATLAALRRVALSVSSDRPAILLEAHGDAIRMRGRDGDGGEAVDEVEAEIEGELRVAFNHKYLLGALDALGGETTVFEPQAGMGPSKFHDPARGDRALAVVMPLGWRE